MVPSQLGVCLGSHFMPAMFGGELFGQDVTLMLPIVHTGMSKSLYKPMCCLVVWKPMSLACAEGPMLHACADHPSLKLAAVAACALPALLFFTDAMPAMRSRLVVYKPRKWLPTLSPSHSLTPWRAASAAAPADANKCTH